jgi:KUP system potassium uptake protein
VTTRGVPEVPPERGLALERLGHGFVRVIATFGFMQTPNIPEVLSRAAAQGVPGPPMETSYYLGRERLVLTGHAKMQRWRKKLFALMSRNARSATEFFQIPPNRVVELGAQIEF